MTTDLTRRTSGLSESHVALLKLLAALAVRNYVAEVEGADAVPGDEAEAATQEAS